MAFYVSSQTGRALKTRVSEHKKVIRGNEENSKVAQHIAEKD
jgi:hypothetical protein